MSGSRPSIFSDDDAGTGIDLSGFAPKTAAAKPPVPPETLEQVSEENGFPSRAPKARGGTPATAQTAGSCKIRPHRASQRADHAAGA